MIIATRSRGRPKSLDRDRVIEVAMMGYWQEGPGALSINKICKRAKVSKPGVYREFGSEDGLKLAILSAYQRMAIEPIWQLLEEDRPFNEGWEALIGLVLSDREVLGLPDGCLHVEMCQVREQLGVLTRAQTDHLRKLNLEAYARWVDRAKGQGQFKADLPTPIAALYIDAQLSAAMRLHKLGEANEVVGAVLRIAMAALI